MLQVHPDELRSPARRAERAAERRFEKQSDTTLTTLATSNLRGSAGIQHAPQNWRSDAPRRGDMRSVVPVVLLLLSWEVASVRSVCGAHATGVRLIQLLPPSHASVPHEALVNLRIRYAARVLQAAADLSDDVPRGVVSLRLRGNPGAQATTHGEQLATHSLVMRSIPFASQRQPWGPAHVHA